tara:strand:+ start:782 stop:1387 length:606 start_codon:yes stop_codon:yes gene_type:complete
MPEKIIQRDIDSLIFAEYNPRQLTKDQYKHLKDSIQRFGLVDPVIINSNKDRKNIIIGGHQRCKVAKDLDIKKIPCVEIDLTYDKERELNVRLNKNTGEWDMDVLANLFELEELQEWGFTDKELKIFDDDEEEIKPEIEISPELFESHNYLVMYFDNDLDWQSAKDVFDIKSMASNDSRDNYERVGIGRVLKGSDVLKKIL